MRKYEALTRNYESLSNSTVNDKSEFMRLRKGNQQYQKEVEVLRQHNEDQKVREQEYKKELERLLFFNKEQKEKLDTRTHELKVRNEELKKIKKHYEEKFKETQGQNKSLQENLQRAKHDLLNKIEELKKANARIQVLEEELSNQTPVKKDNSAEIKVAVERANQENEILLERLAKLRAQLDESTTKLTISESALSKEIKKNEEISIQCQTTTAASQTMEQEYQQTIQRLRDRVAELEKLLEQSNTELEKSKNEVNFLQEQADERDKELKDL